MSQIHTILTHRDPDMDEVEAIRLLKRYGENTYPGISKAEIVTVAKRDFEGKKAENFELEGVLCVGIGGGKFDEHPFGERGRREGECAATLVAKDLGIDANPNTKANIAYALDKNYSAETAEFEIAPLEKLAFKYLSHNGNDTQNYEMESRIFDACFLLLDAVEEIKKNPARKEAPKSIDEYIADWLLRNFGNQNSPSLDIFKLKAQENQGSITVQIAKAIKKSEDKIFYWIIQYAKKHRTPNVIMSENSFELSDLVTLAQQLNYPESQISEAVDIMLNGIWYKYKNFFVDCKRDFNSDSTRVASLKYGNAELRIISLLSTNSEIAKYARSEYGGYSAVVIKRDPNTHNTQIFFNKKNGLDPQPVVKEIRIAERKNKGINVALEDEILMAQGKIEGAEEWFFDGYQILNGSNTTDVSPTQLSREEIEQAVMRGLRANTVNQPIKTDRIKLKTKEENKIIEEKQKYPELFPSMTWDEDNSYLEKIGIYIPNKDSFPKGFIKSMPSDFIVEEILAGGAQTSIKQQSLDVSNKGGPTVFADLVKCGVSTLEAVDILSNLLGISADDIGYAGIKDEDAITSQRISIRRASKQKVESISSPNFFLKNIYTDKGWLSRGGLKGNQFTILVRLGEDMLDTDKIQKALETLERVKQNGFYNFYYTQRFGRPLLNSYVRLESYKWGVSVLNGDYKKAILGLLGDPGEKEFAYFIEKRKKIIEKIPDWDSVLKELIEFPLVFSDEITVVKFLINHPGDYLGALVAIEDKVSLWVQGIASLLFNKKISSYLVSGQEPPAFLPLFTSPDKKDWMIYEDDLRDLGLAEINWQNFKAFGNLTIRHREVSTKDFAEIHNVKIVPEGLIINFSLNKGQYATTLLSHFITLMDGQMNDVIKKNPVDIKLALGEESADSTIKYFFQMNTLRFQ